MSIIALVLALLAQDTIDNPEYKAWALSKPGSSVTFTYLKDGKTTGTAQKNTLKSLADDQLVVETQMITDGKAGPAAERKVPAKLPADQASKKIKEGDEEIEAGEKKLACHWVEYEKKMASGKMVNSKIWVNDEVAGRAARMEFSSDGVVRAAMVATSWEKK